MKNKKSLGQNWLKDRTILEIIAEEARRGSFDPLFPEQPSANLADPAKTANLCVEIGPGLGTLTSSLLRRFEKVLAIEFDENLARNLPKSFPGKNLKVINADILEYDFSNLSETYVVAGNIPYYITSPIITKLLTLKNRPDRIVLLIQKEVAERILAGPGDHTFLSLFVQNYATAEPGIVVTKDYFTPPPKVDSASIILTPYAPKVSDDVLKFIKSSFQNPRKKLIKNLNIDREKGLQIFESLGISENARPEDLDLKTWAELKQALEYET